MHIDDTHSISIFSLLPQLFDRETCTYTYLLADTNTKEAVLIDPVIDLAERDAKLVEELGLTLKYVSECWNWHGLIRRKGKGV